MGLYLGIDTSNYTTSAALYDPKSHEILQRKAPLPVKEGELGLRQSEAVFSHVKQLGGLIEELLSDNNRPLSGVGVSVRPRDLTGSYMPCFLTGECAARSIAAACKVPLTQISHQAGHITAALYSAGQLSWMGRHFAAFHLSGGTTECVLVSPGENIPYQIQLYAQSLDLKAGQAVDRVGQMLGLAFPAGRELETLALRSGKRYFPKPAFHGNDCCLSGVENQCASMVGRGESAGDVARYCLDYILAAVLGMTQRLKRDYPDFPVVYAGGVMSNQILQKEIGKTYGGAFAEPVFSADNAAGAAILAAYAETEAVSCPKRQS